VTNFRKRDKRPASAADRVEPARRLLVVCEGQVTEVQYLQRLPLRHRGAPCRYS
jgi:hypothetical protein